MGFKVLHCADLHLDAVLRNAYKSADTDDLSDLEMQKVRDAPLMALDNICKVAVSENVDAVIITGDIFDKKENTSVNLRCRSRFTNFLEQLNEYNIDVFIALGNHDPLESISEISIAWPKNVSIFPADVPTSIHKQYNSQDVVFHGVSYATADESRNLASMFPQKDPNAINIGLLHTNVGSNSDHSNYAPSSVEQLASHNYDYFGLGHIHKREVINEFPLVAYSGNSQGLSAKPSEQYVKGCNIISIDGVGLAPEVSFIRTDVVRFNSLTVSSTTENIDDLINEIARYIKSQNTDDVFYLTRLQVNLENEIGAVDIQMLKRAINDLRSNTFVTSIKLNFPTKSWSELIESDLYFSHLNEEIEKLDIIDLSELYSSKLPTIENLLGADLENKFSSEDIKQNILKSYVALQRGKQ